MDHPPEILEQLSARVDALEKRVHELEHASTAVVPPAAVSASAEAFGATPDPPSGDQITRAFLLLGKSLLGIAGAYLLRALAESNLLPRLVIAAVAIAYAIGWLVAAARAPTRDRFAPALFACTSALILAPMLWELTMRFHVLAPVASAAVLGLFVAAATALAWRNRHPPGFAVAYGAAAITALALSIVAHQMIAFLLLLLAMLVLCEYKFRRIGMQGVGRLVAAITDCAAWILIVIYRTPASTRTDYPQLGTAALAGPVTLLFLITAASVVFRTAVLRRRITGFETAQSVIAFLLWILTGLFLVPHVSGHIVGIVCLGLAAACYATAYGLFRIHPGKQTPLLGDPGTGAPQSRNFHVFALWSAALFLAGIFLALPTTWAVMCLALASIASAALAGRIGCTTLECHAIVYLGVAATVGGLLEYSFHALAGTMPESVTWSIFLISGCAIVSYAAARERHGEPWQLQLLHLVPALLAVGAVAALTAHGALWLVERGFTPGTFHVALVRTLILCAIALALAFAGSRWR